MFCRVSPQLVPKKKVCFLSAVYDFHWPHICVLYIKVKVKQSHYRPGQALKVKCSHYWLGQALRVPGV
jgi:hypothetical protein